MLIYTNKNLERSNRIYLHEQVQCSSRVIVFNTISTIFQLHHGSQFYWWRNRRKPSTWSKSLTNYITKYCIKYTLPWAGFKHTTLVVIGTDGIGSGKSNYHMITTMTAPNLWNITAIYIIWTIIIYKYILYTAMKNLTEENTHKKTDL